MLYFCRSLHKIAVNSSAPFILHNVSEKRRHVEDRSGTNRLDQQNCLTWFSVSLMANGILWVKKFALNNQIRHILSIHCNFSMVVKATITFEKNGWGQPSMVFWWFMGTPTILFYGFWWLSTIGQPVLKRCDGQIPSLQSNIHYLLPSRLTGDFAICNKWINCWKLGSMPVWTIPWWTIHVWTISDWTTKPFGLHPIGLPMTFELPAFGLHPK